MAVEGGGVQRRAAIAAAALLHCAPLEKVFACVVESGTCGDVQEGAAGRIFSVQQGCVSVQVH
eukprot:CAMPEP_0197454066 /NCGR_PEP_ID=MMETSP1175-20131217/36839_1 /TAXON_ID=1003142 /ORGANISM="Triceratium dubium, Strain CCMP147" /LENGTH=62 /DNA_ID=CAMNT_0042987541 /DNA_START=42 /DNA_END=227 /DNA_ORIENTATION=+